MDILHPQVLLLFLFIVPFVALYFRREQLVTRILKHLAKEPPTSFAWYRSIGLFLVLALICLALARPVTGFEEFKAPSSNQALYVLVDISLSMSATDSLPAREMRINTARRKLGMLAGMLERGDYQGQISIILFAGEAFTLCPLTRDTGVLRQYANLLSDEMLSATGSSLRAALEEFQRARSQIPEMIDVELLIISDGEIDETPEDIHGLLSLLGNGIAHVLLVGSEEGATLRYDHHGIGFGRNDMSPVVRDSTGAPVQSRAIREPLQNFAQRSGGVFALASAGENELQALLRNSDHSFQREESAAETRAGVVAQKIPHEVGSFFCLAAFVLILGFRLVSRRALIVFLIFFTWSAKLAHADSLPHASKLYEQGQFDAAREAYASTEVYNGNSQEKFEAMFGSAASSYRLSDFEAASGSFAKAAELAKSSEDTFRALFNQGNSEFSRNRYREAIAAYEQALELIAGEKKATHNLKLAQELLEREKEQQRDQQQEQQENSESDQREDSRNSSNQEPEEPDQSDSTSSSEPTESNIEEQETGAEKSDRSQSAETPENGDTEQETAGLEDSTDPAEENSDIDSASEAAARAWLDALPEARLLHRVPRRGDQRSPKW
jgi:Ca-activated chloride channel family protein